MSKLNLKPGDRAMLVSYERYTYLLSIIPVTVKSVTPTGRISLNERDEKYRPDGSSFEQGPWANPPEVREWDDALWSKFQQQNDNLVKFQKLNDLIRVWQRMLSTRRNHAEAAALWDSLPDALKVTVEKKEGAP